MAVIASMLFAQSAWAEAPPPAPNASTHTVPSPPDPEPHVEPWTGGDWVMATLAGAGGLFGGALVGVGILLAGISSCNGSSSDCLDSAIGSLILASAVILVSAPLAVYAYGETTGHEGSFWMALLGELAGMLLFGAAVSAIDDNGDNPLRFFTFLVIPLSATAGYALTLPDPPQHSLLDFDPDKGASVGLPSVSVAPTPEKEGGFTIFVPVVSGRF